MNLAAHPIRWRRRSGAVLRLCVFAGLAATGIGATGTAQAQLQQIPGGAIPGREAPQPAPVPPPLTELDWSVQLPPGAEPPPSLKAEILTLNDVRLTGVTVYTREQLSDLFAPLLGREITFEQFYGISQAIQKRYRDDGYVLSFSYVPPQTVEDGVFTIAVVEGFVEAVEIGEADEDLRQTLALLLDPITRVKPLNVATMERYLLLANDLAGVKVTAVLRPSRTVRGATVLVAKVRHTPLGASASVNNQSSDFTGPWKSSATLSVNSPRGTGERITASMSEAMVLNEKKSFSAGFSQPVGIEGFRIDLGASYTSTRPGSTLREFNVRTRTLELNADFTYPVIRARTQTLTVGTGFTFRNAAVNLAGSPFNRDRIRLARAEVNYSNSHFLGGSSRVIVEAARSLKFLNATNPRKVTMSRTDAEMDFARLNLDVSHARPLFDRLSVRASVTGQYTTGPAPASEEFILGGSGFGRAYNSGEVSGENGFGLSAELTYDLDYRTDFIRSVKPYGFFDYGKVWDLRSASSTGPAESLASAGFGLRVGLPFGLTMRLERATPLTRPPSHQNGKTKSRIFFFTNWSY